MAQPAPAPETGKVRTLEAAPPAPHGRFAVFPLVNESGVIAPMRDIGAALLQSLEKQGISAVQGARVDEFLARHRIRYTGGIDPVTAALAARELNVQEVLITTVVSFQREPMPRLAVEARLVTTGAAPRIAWAGGFSRLGDDSPGAFDLGVVRDFSVLAEQGFRGLTTSLGAYLDGKGSTTLCPAAGRFGPRSSFRSPALELTKPVRIAVLPFQNQTRRRNAGDVLSVAFVRQFQGLPNATVAEPGIIRDDLLRFRVVLEGGISLDVARVIMELVDADFALTGIVRTFDDASSAADSVPRVEYTVMLLDRQNNEILWRSTSYSQGDDGVFFFDVGKVSSAADLACRMAQSTVRAIVEQAPTPPRKLTR